MSKADWINHTLILIAQLLQFAIEQLSRFEILLPQRINGSPTIVLALGLGRVERQPNCAVCQRQHEDQRRNPHPELTVRSGPKPATQKIGK